MDKGIYAIKQGNTLEIVNIPLSRTKLKEYRRIAKKQGIKIYAKGL